MKILLDTHCWLWIASAPEHLTAESLALVRATENDLFLSAASAWEIAIKYSAGKLRLPLPPVDYVPTRMATTRVAPLPVQHSHALHVTHLPPHHHDPFDRLLIAQAQVERLPILTADERFSAYDVEVIRAS